MKNFKLNGGVVGMLIGFLVLAILLFVSAKEESAVQKGIPNEETVERVELPDRSGEGNEEAQVTSTPAKKIGTKKTINLVPTLTYEGALLKYKDYRIQFDTQCRAVPNNVTYKNGTEIMLDNRAGVERKIIIGSTYTVPAYGFKIVKLSSTTLPIAWFVDCDVSPNVATILLQR